MDQTKYVRMGMLLYGCLISILFIYLMPFVFIGFGPTVEQGDIPISQLTIVHLTDGQNIPPPARLAIWFAEWRKVRLGLTIFLIIFMVIIELSVKIPNRREGVYLIIAWANMVFFFLNFLGIIVILI